jgi:hypothetical protein
MAVKVILERRVVKGQERAALEILRKMRLLSEKRGTSVGRLSGIAKTRTTSW